MRLHFEVFGDEQIDRTLQRFIEAAEDMRPVWEVLRARFLVIEQRQFASEGRYGSGGWPALSPNYARWKARHYPGRPILVREGDLRRSLTEGPAISVLEPHLMILGSDVGYGAYHQRGDPPLPRRRPIELSDNERREWVKVMQRYLVTGSLGGARGSSLRFRG